MANNLELDLLGLFDSFAPDYLPEPGLARRHRIDEEEAVDPGMDQVSGAGGCIAAWVGVKGTNDG